MKHYRVVFAPEARDQLAAIYRYIADAAANAAVAMRYTESIIAHCERLSDFPYRGVQRDDIRPGLRLTHYRKRAVIAYVVDDQCVSIIGVFYGGQNYPVTLGDAGEALP